MIFSDTALSGKKIVVSGASSGLGLAAAKTMAQCGAHLVLCGRDEDRLTATVAELRGTAHRWIVGDFASINGAHDVLMLAVDDGVPLNGVFHAAGIAAMRMAKLINDDHVSSVFGAALMGAMGIAKVAGKKSVLTDGASVVLMSSVAGQRGRAGMGVYSASRAAVGGLVRSLAAELAPRGIRVNEIVAGAIETPMHKAIVKNLDEAGIAVYRDLHMLGFGQPEDVAAMATFLVSDAARWVTGASMVVDGGYTAR